MATIYPEETIRKLLEQIGNLPILEAIGYRVDTIQEIGDTIKCFCPVHKEAVFRTLIIDRRTRKYRCSYSLCGGHRGGDLIDLFAKAKGIGYDEAVQQIVKVLRIEIDLPPAGDFVQKTLEVAGNYLALQSYDDAREGFQKVLSVEPENLAALKGMLEIHRGRNEEEQRMQVLGRLAAVALKQKDFSEAAECCREILEKDPANVEIRLRYVECLIGREELHRALEEYMRLADYFETRQEFDKALDIYRKIETLDLDIIDVYPHIIQLMLVSDRARDAVEETLRKAAAHERKGEYGRALECYRYALDVDESRADVREKFIDTSIVAGLDDARVGQCLDIINDYLGEEAFAGAARALEKLRKAVPAHGAVMAKYIEVLRREGRDKAAVEAQLDLVEHLLKGGRREEAAKQLRSFGSTEDLGVDCLNRLANAQRQCGLDAQAAETYVAIAEQLKSQGNLTEAADAYETVVALNPAEIAYRKQQVELCLQAGQTDRARDKYAALLEILVGQARWDEAAVVVAKALEIAPDDGALLQYNARVLSAVGRTDEAQVHHLALAQRHVDAERWTEARRALQQVLAANPNHVEAALLFADVGSQLGDTRAARESLQRVVSHLLADKDHERAEAVLRKWHELAPDDPFVLVRLGSVYGNLGRETEQIETYRSLTLAYMANEAYARAMDACTSILERDGENIWALEQMITICEKTDKTRSVPELCLRLAHIYEKLDDADLVQHYYERAVEIEPANIQARSEYVQFLVGLNRFDAASVQAQTAIAYLAEQNRVPEAIRIAEQLLEHAPSDTALRRLLIDLCREAGMHREFITHCTQLINLHYRRNEFDEVVVLYQELLRYEPRNVTFRTHLIDALMRLKRREEAIEQYFELADQYRRGDNHEDAENTLQDLLDQDPGNCRALEMLIEMLIETGQQEQAIERVRELSEIHVGAGRNAQAAEVLRRVLAFDPNNSEIRRRIAEISREDQDLRTAVDAHATRAEASLAEGDVTAAIEAQREAVRRQPDEPALRRRLAEILMQQGSTTAAMEELLQVARLRLEQGHPEDARRVVEDLLAREPSHYAARRLRAEIYAKTGNKEKALEEFMTLTPSTPVPGGDRQTRGGFEVGGAPADSLQVVPDFTFANFVVGDRNRFAHATAMAVAKAPAVHYNPLFLYSDVGLGKTHLISAIANYIATHHPEQRVLYTSAEEFASHLVEAIQNNTVNVFRNRYKATDVLLVDDIHFLAGKERAQEEFFHLFNTLFQSKRQICVTSDRPPKDIARLEKRLVSRFGSGVIVDIQAPDFETRAAILKRELERLEDVSLDDAIISLVAERIKTNVRELKAALQQIVVKHQMSGMEITAPFVKEVLDVFGVEE